MVFQKAQSSIPDLFDMTVLGSVLHSFYNGLENIFTIIAKNIDRNVPIGNKSHQELLQQMTTETNYRSSLIDNALYLKLREYATFRHFYRHAYSFQLNWEKMQPLVSDVKDTWENVKSSLEIFISK